MNDTPVHIALSYEVQDHWLATLALRSYCKPDQRITVIHDAQTGIHSYLLDHYDCLPALVVGNADTLMFTVRDSDQEISACGLYEVRIGLAQIISVILAPITVHNIIITQEDETALPTLQLEAVS